MSTDTFSMEMMGFGCPSCVYTIEKLGRKIPDVESVSVSMADQRIQVTHNGDQTEIAQQLASIVNRIGHEVREIPDSASS
jgi:copper chaperone CopZ